jgi:uncharacterized membrane protein YfcA
MIDLSGVSPWLWVIAPATILAAYVVFGMSGFGSTMISLPILAHFLPLAFLVPLMVLLDLTASLVIGGTGRRHVSVAEMKRILPLSIVGIFVGVAFLVKLPQEWLRVALGVFAIGVGLNSIVNPVLKRTISWGWCIPTGIFGGASSALFGAGGPIYAAYLSGRLRDKSEIRATVSSIISISALLRAIVYAVTGLLLHVGMFVAMAILAPFAWIGFRIGSRIHVGLSQANMRRALGAVLLCSGTSLLLRVLL